MRAFELEDELRDTSTVRADLVLSWVCGEHPKPLICGYSDIQRAQNIAFAWRQAVYLLSFAPEFEAQTVAHEWHRAILSDRSTKRFV